MQSLLGSRSSLLEERKVRAPKSKVPDNTRKLQDLESATEKIPPFGKLNGKGKGEKVR